MGSGRKHKICIILFLFSLFSCIHTVEKTPVPLKNGEVIKEMKKIYPELVKCYERTITGKNGFYGKGLLTLKINKNGDIKEYEWKPQPPDNFVICTDRTIKSLHFRKLPDSVKIELPVSFIISVEDKYEIK